YFFNRFLAHLYLHSFLHDALPICSLPKLSGMAARLLLASRRGVADRRVSAPVESLRQDRLERSPRTDGGLAPWLRRLAERLVDRARSATARGCEHSSGKRIASLDYLTRRRESAPSG